jgi:hypothetical protein
MNLLNLEDDKFKTINVRGYKFKIRFISPKDRILIGQKRAIFQGGQPLESFTESEFIFYENIAINDLCIEETPDQFNSFESCANWDDETLINDIASEIRKHTQEIQEKLKKNKHIEGSEG